MRILAYAYACEPEHGSEPGAGWAWARMLSRFGETWVITRANNKQAIEDHLPSIDERDRLHFVYVDLPGWARFWKRGQRGIHLYYPLWLIAALRQARALHREVDFDLVWHLTLSPAWFGSTASLVGPKFVYGPVGGGVTVPWRLLPSLGVRGLVSEIIRQGVVTSARFLNPLARLSWRRADLILAQNPETRDWFPRAHSRKIHVFPNVVLDLDSEAREFAREGSPQTAVFASRLLPWKGGHLAIDAVRLVPDCHLIIVGSGPDKPRLEKLAAREGMAERVSFVPWMARADFLELLRRADVMVFPSLREDAGWVVAEALALGVPVVCLDRGGPPSLGAHSVLASTYAMATKALSDAVRESTPSPMPEFNLDVRCRELRWLPGDLWSETSAWILETAVEVSGSTDRVEKHRSIPNPTVAIRPQMHRRDDS